MCRERKIRKSNRRKTIKVRLRKLKKKMERKKEKERGEWERYRRGQKY